MNLHAVSYTHLDVYKRQSSALSDSDNDCSESNGYDLFVSVVVIGSPESGDNADEVEDNAGEPIRNTYHDD